MTTRPLKLLYLINICLINIGLRPQRKEGLFIRKAIDPLTGREEVQKLSFVRELLNPTFHVPDVILIKRLVSGQGGAWLHNLEYLLAEGPLLSSMALSGQD